MHIRHLVCTDAFAGVERYISYVAVELASRGHVVDVVGGDPVRMQEALAPAAVTHHAATSVPSVARAAAAGPRPDIVHSHMTAADIAAVVTRPLLRRPIVSTLHFAHPRGHDAVTRTAYGALRPLMAAEVAISEYVATAAAGSPVVIPHGIPAPRATPPVQDRAKVVLMVQRLEREKDAGTALRAWALSGLKDEGWTLRVLGEGRDRVALDALIEELGVRGSVDLPGSVDDVAERMAAASLLLATTPNEGFGLAVVEAMAAGLPVIAADGGAHRETVGAASGTLFPVGDAQAAAALLDALGADPDRRAALGDVNRRRFEAEYTIARHVDRLEALYQGLLRR